MLANPRFENAALHQRGGNDRSPDALAPKLDANGVEMIRARASNRQIDGWERTSGAGLAITAALDDALRDMREVRSRHAGQGSFRYFKTPVFETFIAVRGAIPGRFVGKCIVKPAFHSLSTARAPQH